MDDLFKPIISLLETQLRQLREMREILQRGEARSNTWLENQLRADNHPVVRGKRILALEERTAKIERLLRKET